MPLLPASSYGQETDLRSSTDQAIELFNRAQDLHAKGELLKAIEIYEKALVLLPEFPEAEYQKGSAYLSLGKPDEAEKAFRRAVGLRGEWTLALTALGNVLQRKGEHAEAEKLLVKAISLDDSSFAAYSGLVELRLKESASSDTLKPLLEKMRGFAANPNANSAAFITLASLERATGDIPAARKSIARALAIEPSSKDALFEKAEIALSEADLLLANEVIRQLEKLDGAAEPVKVLRARHMGASGKPEDALKLIATIEKPSKETVSLAEKLKLLSERSVEVLEKALAKDPKDIVVLSKLCSEYRVTAPEKALDVCKRALEIEPSNIDHAVGFGAALLQAKRYQEAVTVLRRLLEAAPDSATIRANLATALFQLKRYQEAKVEYRWLTSREPAPPIAYYFLAICHDQLGEFLDAGANYNLFLKFADATKNQLEIDKVKLRLPSLDRDIKRKGNRGNSKSG